ncbi:MAG TPA: amino acid adenylation domain-containing protein [Candidatus Angelobacter sp.]
MLELNPDRNLNRSPLFQVMLTLQNAPAPDFRLAGLRLEPLTLDLGISQFDMALSVWEERGRVEGWLEYSTELFEMQTVQRFLEHWQHAIEEMVADPGKEIPSVHLLAAKERRQILEEWNATAQENQLDHCVHELFEQNAQRTPEALAVVHGEDELTYRELNERSNQLAHYVMRLNLGPEKLVGIFLPRSTEMIVAMLATLKAGAAYIPLDPDYPPERLRFMLDNASASMVLTHAALANRLGWRRELTVSLDDHRDAVAKESSANSRTRLLPLNLAYVIYTSGSTGQPKGVQISHASLLNLVRWHLHAFDMSSTDAASQMASLGFDAAVWEIWPCLVAGAKLCLVDDHVRLSPADLRDLILARNITVSFMPTPVAESVLALEWPETASLKTLLAGGDKLHRCVSRPLPFVLVNNYGPTECTVVATSIEVDHNKEMDPPIGHPIRNTKVYVLDREMEPVPARVAGELYIGGASLARSYVNHPETTAEKFVPDPFSKEPGARLYRTGDLARWRLDGTLEFLGRADEQVKIRGFRIELGEIETALREISGVRDAVVTVLEEQAGQKQLVAYVTGSVASITEFRRHLQRRLPAYMIPAAFVPMESLPLTSNGKVDRRSLPKPNATDWHEQEYVPPRTATEQLICQIFTQVLGVEQIGLHDNFFHLGGHSLLASKVILRLEEMFQIKLPLRVLFEAANPEDLSQAIEEALLAEIESIPEPVAGPFAGSRNSID